MKKFTFYKCLFAFLTMTFCWSAESFAQCQIPNPIPFYTQNFGTGARAVVSPLTLNQVPELTYVGTGNMDPEKIYTITPTSNLHSNGTVWHTVTDHTGNANGRMMLVNDREPAGVTYRDDLPLLTLGQGNLYYFSAWVMNILRPGVCTGSGNNPDIFVSLKVEYKLAGNPAWTTIANSPIFTYPSTALPVWNKIGLNFITPAFTYESIRISVNNGSVVLCGNDYVLDDINITGCVNNISLPVSLLSFTGNYRNGTTTLNWEAENEVNFSHYEIERKSASSSLFSSIATAAVQSSNGKSLYQHSDNISSLSGDAFQYRLKMVDIDGSFKYSNVVMVRKDQKVISGIAIAPNPVTTNAAAIVRFESAANNTAVTIRVVDWTGRVVLTQHNKVNEGTNSISVNGLQRLQPGLYVIQVSNGDELTAMKFSVTR